MATLRKITRTLRKALQKRKGWKKNALPVFMSSVGAALIVVAGLQYIDRSDKTAVVTEASDITSLHAVVTEDVDEPDENKPDVAAVAYEVPADMPRRIIMPDIGVNGFVQQVGITDDNAVAVPTNIHIGGWFTDSVLPGQKGLSIIDGHVSGRYSDGIFKQLHYTTLGTVFEIEFGDRSRKQFEVVSISQMSEVESAAALFDKDPEITSQLNLITCGGDFDRDSESYQDRVVLVSRAIDDAE